jgi:hypothetical protein
MQEEGVQWLLVSFVDEPPPVPASLATSAPPEAADAAARIAELEREL